MLILKQEDKKTEERMTLRSRKPLHRRGAATQGEEEGGEVREEEPPEPDTNLGEVWVEEEVSHRGAPLAQPLPRSVLYTMSDSDTEVEAEWQEVKGRRNRRQGRHRRQTDGEKNLPPGQGGDKKEQSLPPLSDTEDEEDKDNNDDDDEDNNGEEEGEVREEQSMEPGSLLGLAGLAMWNGVCPGLGVTEIVVRCTTEDESEEEVVCDADTTRLPRCPLPLAQRRMLEVAKQKAAERQKAIQWLPSLLPAGPLPSPVNEELAEERRVQDAWDLAIRQAGGRGLEATTPGRGVLSQAAPVSPPPGQEKAEEARGSEFSMGRGAVVVAVEVVGDVVLVPDK